MFSNFMTIESEKKVQALIVKYVELLTEKINSYFPKCVLKPMDWIRNLFSNSISLGHLSINEQEIFMDLKNDRTIKLKFFKTELAYFWLHIKNEYPLRSKRAIEILLPFTTT